MSSPILNFVLIEIIGIESKIICNKERDKNIYKQIKIK